jgi:hypothetical protein
MPKGIQPDPSQKGIVNFFHKLERPVDITQTQRYEIDTVASRRAAGSSGCVNCCPATLFSMQLRHR